MGSFSVWHWIVVLFTVANLAMIVHIAVSSRTAGWQKGAWLVGAFVVPLVPYLIWLVARPSPIDGYATERVRATRPPSSDAVPTSFPSERSIEPTEGAHSATATPEEVFWSIAAEELDGPDRRRGLWAKVFSEAQGNEAAAKANYLKWRVAQLQQEEAKRNQQVEEARLAIEERQSQAALAERAKVGAACPCCERVISMAAIKCPHCRASFASGSPYKLRPLSKP